MLTVIAGRTIVDTSNPSGPCEFTIPDMVKLINSSVTKGDEALIPVSLKNGTINFWESGGRNPKGFVSTANLIATENDTIPEAILFNKLNKNPNGKHALISLRPGYRLYIGKIHMRNSLSPKVKVLRLVFQELSSDTDDQVPYGRFVVDQVFSSYQDMYDNKPATRLLSKLFTDKVVRPYFANGWSVSNISSLTVSVRELLRQAYIRLASHPAEIKHFTVADDFLDNVEDTIVSLNNPRLSAALQTIDFNTGTMTIRPLSGIELSNISGTIDKSDVVASFAISLKDLENCYNPNILFSNTDFDMLEMALERDHTNTHEFVTELGSRVFGILRGFRG